MKERISLQELVALNNTPKAKALLNRYGYERTRSYGELIDKLYLFTHDYREEALSELAKLHPHRDLILSSLPKERKYNGDGECPTCGHNNNRYSNFEMSEEYLDFLGSKKDGTNSTDKLKEYLPMIAVAGIFALAITAIGKG
jgi:hypothetical protein